MEILNAILNFIIPCALAFFITILIKDLVLTKKQNQKMKKLLKEEVRKYNKIIQIFNEDIEEIKNETEEIKEELAICIVERDNLIIENSNLLKKMFHWKFETRRLQKQFNYQKIKCKNNTTK